MDKFRAQYALHNKYRRASSVASSSISSNAKPKSSDTSAVTTSTSASTSASANVSTEHNRAIEENSNRNKKSSNRNHEKEQTLSSSGTASPSASSFDSVDNSRPSHASRITAGSVSSRKIGRTSANDIDGAGIESKKEPNKNVKIDRKAQSSFMDKSTTSSSNTRDYAENEIDLGISNQMESMEQVERKLRMNAVPEAFEPTLRANSFGGSRNINETKIGSSYSSSTANMNLSNSNNARQKILESSTISVKNVRVSKTSRDPENGDSAKTAPITIADKRPPLANQTKNTKTVNTFDSNINNFKNPTHNDYRANQRIPSEQSNNLSTTSKSSANSVTITAPSVSKSSNTIQTTPLAYSVQQQQEQQQQQQQQQQQFILAPTEAQLRWAQFHKKQRARKTQSNLEKLMSYPIHETDVDGYQSGDGDSYTSYESCSCSSSSDSSTCGNDVNTNNKKKGLGEKYLEKLSHHQSAFRSSSPQTRPKSPALDVHGDGTISYKSKKRKMRKKRVNHKIPPLSRGRRALLRVSARRTEERQKWVKENGFLMEPDDEEDDDVVMDAGQFGVSPEIRSTSQQHLANGSNHFHAAEPVLGADDITEALGVNGHDGEYSLFSGITGVSRRTTASSRSGNGHNRGLIGSTIRGSKKKKRSKKKKGTSSQRLKGRRSMVATIEDEEERVRRFEKAYLTMCGVSEMPTPDEASKDEHLSPPSNKRWTRSSHIPVAVSIDGRQYDDLQRSPAIRHTPPSRRYGSQNVAAELGGVQLTDRSASWLMHIPKHETGKFYNKLGMNGRYNTSVSPDAVAGEQEENIVTPGQQKFLELVSKLQVPCTHADIDKSNATNTAKKVSRQFFFPDTMANHDIPSTIEEPLSSEKSESHESQVVSLDKYTRNYSDNYSVSQSKSEKSCVHNDKNIEESILTHENKTASKLNSDKKSNDEKYCTVNDAAVQQENGVSGTETGATARLASMFSSRLKVGLTIDSNDLKDHEERKIFTPFKVGVSVKGIRKLFSGKKSSESDEVQISPNKQCGHKQGSLAQHFSDNENISHQSLSDSISSAACNGEEDDVISTNPLNRQKPNRPQSPFSNVENRNRLFSISSKVIATDKMGDDQQIVKEPTVQKKINEFVQHRSHRATQIKANNSIIDTDNASGISEGMEPEDRMDIISHLMFSPTILTKRHRQAISAIENQNWDQILYLLNANPWLAEMTDVHTNQYLLHKLALHGSGGSGLGDLGETETDEKQPAPEKLNEDLIKAFPASVHKIDQDGNLPLHMAAQSGNYEMILRLGKLFSSGASVRNNDGYLPLHLGILACAIPTIAEKEESPVRIMKSILDLFPSALAVADNDGNLPLHLAASSLNGDVGLDVIFYLLDEYDKKSGSLQLPSRIRSCKKLEDDESESICSDVMSTSTDVLSVANQKPDSILLIRNSLSRTPLMCAIKQKVGWEIVDALLSCKGGEIAVYDKDENNQNILQLTVGEMYSDPATILSILKVAPNLASIRDEDGILPIEVACLRGMQREVIMALALVDLPVDLDSKDDLVLRKGFGGSWSYLTCDCDDAHVSIVKEILAICSYKQKRELCFTKGKNGNSIIGRSTPKCKLELRKALRFAGRYEFLGSASIRSDSSSGLKVFEALDFEAGNDPVNVGRKVFLNCYNEEESFNAETEIFRQSQLDCNLVEEINVFCAHDIDAYGDIPRQYCLAVERPILTLSTIVSGITNDDKYKHDRERFMRYLSKVCTVLRLIGKGIRHMHKVGVIHGNIGMHNCGKFEDRWKVMGLTGMKQIGENFTLARLDSSAPPEAVEFSGEGSGQIIASPAIDIWGFGKLMYEVLLGETLFDIDTNVKGQSNKSILTVLGAWNEDDLRYVVEKIESIGIGKVAADLISHCLCPFPEDRPANMEEVLSHPFWKHLRMLSISSSG